MQVGNFANLMIIEGPPGTLHCLTHKPSSKIRVVNDCQKLNPYYICFNAKQKNLPLFDQLSEIVKNAFTTRLSEKITKKFKWALNFFLGPIGKKYGHF